MLTLDLGNHRQGRLWLDELPDLHYPPLRVAERTVAVPAGGSRRQKAAAELLVPMGPRAMYGLLGATHTADGSGSLRVQVVLSGADGKVYPAALAGRLDQVRAGLPEEYGDSVLAGVLSAEALARLGPGVLRIDCAAHGPVGSSPWLFQRLAGVVVLALTAAADVAWEEEVRRLLT